MLNLSFVNPTSPSSHTLTAYILWIQQTRTAESEVLHTILPNDHQLGCRILKQQNIMKTGCPSDWYTAFRDSYLSTICNTLCLNPCNCNCCHSPRSQLYPPSKFCKILHHSDNFVPHGHHSYARTGHNELTSAESYAGASMINPFLNIPYVRPWELVSDTIMLMSQVHQVCQDLQVRLVQF